MNLENRILEKREKKLNLAGRVLSLEPENWVKQATMGRQSESTDKYHTNK